MNDQDTHEHQAASPQRAGAAWLEPIHVGLHRFEQRLTVWLRTPWARRYAGHLVLLALLALIAVKKIWLSQHVTDFDTDGGFFTTVAQQVRNGNGLATNVAVFHKGFESFPHPTSVYPLWPLLYGWLGKIFPLYAVGIWMPTLAYFATLLLAYNFGRRWSAAPLFGSVVPGFHAGHLLVLVVGLNQEYFEATSMPFTEGVAFLVLFGLLCRTPQLFRRPGLWAGLEWGVWLTLLLLARSQFLVVWIAAALAWAWALIFMSEARWKMAITGAVAAVTVALCLAPYFAFRAEHFQDASLLGYLQFNQARANSLLSPVPFYVQTQGLFHYLIDRAQGIAVAFTWEGKGFYRSFDLWAYAPPIAVVIALWHALREPERWWGARRWLSEPSNGFRVFALLVACGGYFSLFTVHKVYASEWHFDSRQGFFAFFLIFFALLWLVRRGGGRVYVLGASILLIGAYNNYYAAHGAALAASLQDREGAELSVHRPELSAWLEVRRAAAAGPLVVAAQRPWAQRLGWRHPDIGFHWVTDTTSFEDLETMFEALGARYVIFVDPSRVHPVVRDDPRFSTRYRRIARFPVSGECHQLHECAVVFERVRSEL